MEERITALPKLDNEVLEHIMAVGHELKDYLKEKGFPVSLVTLMMDEDSLGEQMIASYIVKGEDHSYLMRRGIHESANVFGKKQRYSYEEDFDLDKGA